MSRFQRVQQWCAFSRKWFIYDAKYQNPFHSARKIAPVLEGKKKPIYHPSNDCGDHVIVINSRHVALLGQEWTERVYFHHTGYPKTFGGHCGPKWILAWQLHSRDPTLVMWKAVYNQLKGGLGRRNIMARLHIFPDDKIPEDILINVSGQIRQIKPKPRKLEQYSAEEVENFPKLWDYPEEYILK